MEQAVIPKCSNCNKEHKLSKKREANRILEGWVVGLTEVGRFRVVAPRLHFFQNLAVSVCSLVLVFLVSLLFQPMCTRFLATLAGLSLATLRICLICTILFMERVCRPKSTQLFSIYIPIYIVKSSQFSLRFLTFQDIK
jgi:hypothetical protein